MRALPSIAGFFLLLCALGWGQTMEDLEKLKLDARRLHDRGEHRLCVAKAREALQASLSVHGERHEVTSYCAWLLGDSLKALEDYEAAEPYLKLSLKIDEAIQGPNEVETSISLENLASLYSAAGDSEQAIPLYKRALKIREKLLDPWDASTASCHHNLALVLEKSGKYEEALTHMGRALEICEKTLGPDHLNTSKCLESQGLLYHYLGQPETALPLLQRAMEILEENEHSESLAAGRILSTRALVYEAMGDYDQALELFEMAQATMENLLGPEHSSIAIAHNNIGFVQVALGRYELAIPQFERALEIQEQTIGTQHPTTATSLTNLAYTYKVTERYDLALELNERALRIIEKTLGPDHSATANSVDNLCALYLALGDHERALELGLRGLEIRRASLGSIHPDLSISCNKLAMLYIALQSPVKAQEMARMSSNALLANTRRVFTFASERQRLAFQRSHSPFNLFATLGNASDLAQEALRYKGLVLDSIVEDLRLADASSDPATRELAAEVRATKSQLNKLVFESSSRDAKNQAAIGKREQKLLGKLENLQSELARAGVEDGKVRQAFRITPAEVQQALPPDSVLLEFLRYDHYLGNRNWQARYGAVLLSEQGATHWVPLPGSAADLELLVDDYKRVMRGQEASRFVLSADAETDCEVPASQLLKELYAVVWQPIQEALPPEATIIILSPDGELNFLSFATLLTPDDMFLAEKYALVYVSSGRDLVANPVSGSNEVRYLFGDPDYSGKTTVQVQSGPISRAVRREEWGAMSFLPLPFTRRECEGLKSLFDSRELAATCYLGEQATETNIRQLQAPQILHLATHGYFLPNSESDRVAVGIGRPLPVRDPMYRSGLALAGAQSAVEQRLRGESPNFRNDGLLTAAEIGVLNLKGTELVTLSACDTGRGESRAGEGILGLRRGFVQAGARNLVMTLWQVADKETAQLMQDFYTRADSQPAPLAMADVQREWLVRLRAERSLAEAVKLAGPFVLSFQGRLE